MMIKYRVHEVAKDLNVPNKFVIEQLQKHCDTTKKYMTALTEDELDVVLDSFTQERELASLDEYFADNQPDPKPQAAAAAPRQEEPRRQQGQQNQQGKKAAGAKAGQNNNGQAQQQKKRSDNRASAAPAAKGGQQKPQAPKSQPAQPQETPSTSGSIQRSTSRLVDTRASNVDIERYNEKYDRLASEKVRTDNTVQKQKITQRSQRRGKPRNSRKETEAERLRRIAMERKAKPITVQIPDEITVGELALRLKATAAEVIKKLMMMGTMATVNDVIDFDTASLVAMEFHAKVEKEVDRKSVV